MSQIRHMNSMISNYLGAVFTTVYVVIYIIYTFSVCFFKIQNLKLTCKIIYNMMYDPG